MSRTDGPLGSGLSSFFLVAFLLCEFVGLHSSQEAPPAGTRNF
ncbi:hypothetical protein QUA94_15925 [Microcoleus sp. F8-D2]